MPRQRYESDDARLKVRPHVKVHLTTRSHARTVGPWADPEMRGMIVGLWQLAAEAFAGRTSDTVHLSASDVSWITGRRRRDVALTSLQRLANVMGYSLELRGDVAVIQIRNFSKKQGFNSASRGVPPATPPPSDSDSESDTERREEPVAEAAPAERSREVRKPRSRRASSARTAAPEVLDALILGELQRWCREHEDPGIRKREPAVPQLVELCFDHHRAKGTLAADWGATARTWIRNDLAFARRDGNERSREEMLESARVREVVAAMRARPDPERDAAIARATAERERGMSPETLELWNRSVHKPAGDPDVH